MKADALEYLNSKSLNYGDCLVFQHKAKSPYGGVGNTLVGKYFKVSKAHQLSYVLNYKLEGGESMSAAATLGKLVGIVMIFVIFYVLLQLPSPIGEAIVLSLIAANLAELKIILTSEEK